MKAYIETYYCNEYVLRSDNNTYITFGLDHINNLIETLLEIKHKSDNGLLLIDQITVDKTCVHLRRHNNKCCTSSNWVYYDDIDNIIDALQNSVQFAYVNSKLNKDDLKDKSLKELKLILAHVDRKRKEKINEKASCD